MLALEEALSPSCPGGLQAGVTRPSFPTRRSTRHLLRSGGRAGVGERGVSGPRCRVLPSPRSWTSRLQGPLSLPGAWQALRGRRRRSGCQEGWGCQTLQSHTVTQPSRKRSQPWPSACTSGREGCRPGCQGGRGMPPRSDCSISPKWERTNVFFFSSSSWGERLCEGRKQAFSSALLFRVFPRFACKLDLLIKRK